MKQQLETILNEALAEINTAKTSEDIENIKLNYLSRKGTLNSIKKNLKDLSVEDKRIVGSLANEVAQTLETKLADKSAEIYKIELAQKLESEKIDITLSGTGHNHGKLNPLTSTINEIVEIFQGLGFSVMANENSPEVETEYVNFDIYGRNDKSVYV